MRRKPDMLRFDGPLEDKRQLSHAWSEADIVSGHLPTSSPTLTSSAMSFLVLLITKCGSISRCMTPRRSCTISSVPCSYTFTAYDRCYNITGHSFTPLALFDRIDHKFPPLLQSSSMTSLNLDIRCVDPRTLTKSRTLHISSSRFWIRVPVKAKQLGHLIFFIANPS